MSIIKNGFNFLCSKLFYNIIIMVLLAISIILIFFSSTNYMLFNEVFTASKDLNDKGIVYLNSFNENLSETEHAYNNVQDIHIIYDNNMAVDNSLVKIMSYDEYLINIYAKYLVDGRLPKDNNGVIEVLVKKDTYALGDTINIYSPKDDLYSEFIVVGTLAENARLLTATVSADKNISLNDIYDDSRHLSIPLIIGLSEAMSTQFNLIAHRNIYLRYDKDYYNANKDAIISDLNNHGYAYAYNDIYDSTKANYRTEMIIIIVIMLFAIIASLAMLAINLILLFNRDIKYLTILYINGFSMTRILSIILSYVIIAIIASYLVAYLIITQMIPLLYPFGINIGISSYLYTSILGVLIVIMSYVIIKMNLRANKLIENINKDE